MEWLCKWKTSKKHHQSLFEWKERSPTKSITIFCKGHIYPIVYLYKQYPLWVWSLHYYLIPPERKNIYTRSEKNLQEEFTLIASRLTYKLNWRYLLLMNKKNLYINKYFWMKKTRGERDTYVRRPILVNANIPKIKKQ